MILKKINDTFGHHIGDKVLKQVANIIQRNTRTEDIAARWGGEELAVYLPGVLEEKGVEIAKRISREVEMDTNPQITVSAGVSAWNDAIPKSVVELFIRTDQALYEAKKFWKELCDHEIHSIKRWCLIYKHHLFIEVPPLKS